MRVGLTGREKREQDGREGSLKVLKLRKGKVKKKKRGITKWNVRAKILRLQGRQKKKIRIEGKRDIGKRTKLKGRYIS